MKKRALIVGATDARPNYLLDPRPSVDVMRGLLEQLGGWTLEILEGVDADRDRMLATLHKLAEEVEPDDTVLFYFFGHGGVVRFIDGPGELGLRPVFYLSAARRATDNEVTGVLDFELSALLGRMDSICQNVTAILDCCHSALIVRGKEIREVQAPTWVRALQVPTSLSSDGHPRLVRFAATSALHSAFARPMPNGRLGFLTEGLAAVIRDAELALDRLTWDAVVHRVREHAIQAKGYEEQWVTLAGPRNRLLFSRTEIELPRTVGFVPSHDADQGWLRAGLLQGVNVGDEWGIAALTLDAERRPRLLARVRVVECDLDRARVELLGSADAVRLADGSSALLQRANVRFSVLVEGATQGLPHALDASPLLRVAGADELVPLARVTVRATPPSFVLRREADGLVPLPIHDDAQALALLDDWGRSQLLLNALERCPCPPSPMPVDITWSLVDDERELRLPPSGATLQEGQQVSFALSHAGLTPEAWYVCAIQLDVAGRPILLDSSEPEGSEIQPRQTIYIGRSHPQQPTDLVLRWPEGIPRDRPRHGRVVFLMSLRPIQLGHLVPTPTWPSGQNGCPPLRDSDPTSIPPAPSSKWAWTQVTYQLQPSPLDEPPQSRHRP